MKRDEGIKKLMAAGFEFDQAALAFDTLDETSESRREINRRYYEKNKRPLQEKSKLRRLKKPRSDAIQMVQTSETTRYLAKIGTPQHDAWNAYTHDTKGKGLPHSDKHNGWIVPSEWPPGRGVAA